MVQQDGALLILRIQEFVLSTIHLHHWLLLFLELFLFLKLLLLLLLFLFVVILRMLLLVGLQLLIQLLDKAFAGELVLHHLLLLLLSQHLLVLLEELLFLILECFLLGFHLWWNIPLI